ncbi:flagellar biosynthesis protein [Cohnella sp. CFH 77786]|uniref:TIGR02530 family flagellar biosynthesis protein n=1 Tax=Cohnella sp. CFH 77786 TaxID=2662265 RepID=UPI001C60D9A7|nr:TIGR02530 family flagellar biosynthesis protein [Cohnella sp. CFH 77786]MBW5444570.1 flagellar biosynthesis protein [Cohnella sp. CFH 77786]
MSDHRIMTLPLTAGRAAPLQGTRALARTPGTSPEGVSFRELLQRQQLKFSHHAEQRLEQRGIVLNSDQLERIAGAVDQAAAKGARDSLVLFRDIAMIVNVPNRTVVTAMDGSSMKEHVFTQIDSAVVVS